MLLLLGTKDSAVSANTARPPCKTIFEARCVEWPKGEAHVAANQRLDSESPSKVSTHCSEKPLPSKAE